MDIYHYSGRNGEYLGVSEAKLDPVGSNPMIPGNATDQEPPTPGNNQAARFNAGTWEIVPDYRGSVWYDDQANQHTITEINQEPDPAWTEQKPVLPEPPVTVVSMRQARLSLNQAGLLTDVQNAIDGLSEPDRTQAAIEWEYAGTVERSGPITQMLAGALGLTETDLDNLFTTAAGL